MMIRLTILIISLSTRGTVAVGPDELSSWDAALPSLELENVRVEARSIVTAWQRFSTDYLLRTILYLPVETSRDSVPFSFSAQHCSAADVFNAFVATYPDMTWTPDPQTGVIWFHPHSVPYSKILARKVRLDSDMLGVRMQTGVLEPIGKLAPYVLRVKTWGTMGDNTFNYAVSLARGTYTVRDLLNTCCKTQIGTTFYIRTYIRSSKNVESIMALSLFPEHPERNAKDDLDFPRPGALLWWIMNIGPLEEDAPQEDEVINKLASSDPKERSSASTYLYATILRTPIEKWMKEIEDPHKSLWVTLAFADTLLRNEQVTYMPKRMKKEVTSEFLMTADPALAFLTALELGRVAHDTHYLDILSRRNFAPGDLSGVVADCYRICRQAPEVRRKLADIGMDWFVAAEPMLAGLAEAQSQCEFKLVNATVTK